MPNPKNWPMRWTRPMQARRIDLPIASNQIWTRSYEREIARWCGALRGAVDSSTAHVLDARINADRDDDLARLWQVATRSKDDIGAVLARCDLQASVARTKATALIGHIRTIELQLQEVDRQLAGRREPSREPDRTHSKQRQA